jgi:hypothetical protein
VGVKKLEEYTGYAVELNLKLDESVFLFSSGMFVNIPV